MEKVEIPLLTVDDILCRVQRVTSTRRGTFAQCLLYKDARVDMRILDEVYGPMNWQRKHEVIDGNLYCTIEVWDNEKKCWVGKSDVGKESNTEAEKGQASDSFKRAGFCWGIGRELYTAPSIRITLGEEEFDHNGGKPKMNGWIKFKPSIIGYNERREINALQIVDGNGNIRYEIGVDYDAQTKARDEQAKQERLEHEKAQAEKVVIQHGGANREAYNELLSTWKQAGRDGDKLDAWIETEAKKENLKKVPADFLQWLNGRIIEYMVKEEQKK